MKRPTRFPALTILLSLVLLAASPLAAQDDPGHSIGYTDAELILSLMPEAKDVEKQLTTYQEKLMEKIKVRESYFQTKYEEFMELSESGNLSPDEQESRRSELMKLQKEIQQSQQDAQEKLMQKREELLKPLVERMQTAVDKVRKEKGYTYILNANVAGSSTILSGPTGNNVTKAVLKEMGVEIPDELENPAGADVAPATPPAGTTGGGLGGSTGGAPTTTPQPQR